MMVVICGDNMVVSAADSFQVDGALSSRQLLEVQEDSSTESYTRGKWRESLILNPTHVKFGGRIVY